jgi:hypothetical protein
MVFTHQFRSFNDTHIGGCRDDISSTVFSDIHSLPILQVVEYDNITFIHDLAYNYIDLDQLFSFL